MNLIKLGGFCNKSRKTIIHTTLVKKWFKIVGEFIFGKIEIIVISFNNDSLPFFARLIKRIFSALCLRYYCWLHYISCFLNFIQFCIIVSIVVSRLRACRLRFNFFLAFLKFFSKNQNTYFKLNNLKRIAVGIFLILCRLRELRKNSPTKLFYERSYINFTSFFYTFLLTIIQHLLHA